MPATGLVVSATYSLPFTGHVLTRGWDIASIVQAQSGNFVNIVTSNASINGLPNTVRPDLTGPSASSARSISGSIRRCSWPSIASVIWAGMPSPDLPSTTPILSLMKNLRLGTGARLQFRVDVFDLFNHPNFGPPGNIVGSPTSARSRGRGCQRVKRDRRGKFSSPSTRRSEMTRHRPSRPCGTPSSRPSSPRCGSVRRYWPRSDHREPC